MATVKSRKESSRPLPYKSKERNIDAELCRNKPELVATPGLEIPAEDGSNKEPAESEDNLNPFLTNSP